MYIGNQPIQSVQAGQGGRVFVSHHDKIAQPVQGDCKAPVLPRIGSLQRANPAQPVQQSIAVLDAGIERSMQPAMTGSSTSQDKTRWPRWRLTSATSVFTTTASTTHQPTGISCD